MANRKRRAAVVYAPEKWEIREYDLEPLQPTDAWMKVEMCGVCGTDVHIFHNEDPFPWAHPFVLGHEPVGVLAEVGPDFPKKDEYGNPLAEGDRIVFQSWTCGECYACRTLLVPNLCMGSPRAHKRELPAMMGGFNEYVYVPEEAYIFRVPDRLPTEVAVLVEPMHIALGAVERALMPGAPQRGEGMGPGKVVAILGTGTIGLLAMIVAKTTGAYKVIMIGGPEYRLKLCREFGADHVISIDDVTDPEERIQMVRDLTPHGLGADVVIEAAGVAAAFKEGIEMARRGGALVEIGHFTDRGTVEINPFTVCFKHLDILGSWVTPPADFGTALRVLEANQDRFDFAKLITHRFSLEETGKAVELARSQQAMKPVVLL